MSFSESGAAAAGHPRKKMKKTRNARMKNEVIPKGCSEIARAKIEGKLTGLQNPYK